MSKPGLTRREAVLTGAALTGGAVLLTSQAAQAAPRSEPRSWEPSYSGSAPALTPLPPGQPGQDYAPTVTPGGATLPWKVVAGVKVYHLVAEEVLHEFASGLS